MSRIDVTWFDHHRQPQQKPDARYPSGIDIDMAAGAKQACLVELPYPAKGCGIYLVYCNSCKHSAAITTAGRADDPRSVKLPCKVGPKIRESAL